MFLIFTGYTVRVHHDNLAIESVMHASCTGVRNLLSPFEIYASLFSSLRDGVFKYIPRKSASVGTEDSTRMEC